MSSLGIKQDIGGVYEGPTTFSSAAILGYHIDIIPVLTPAKIVKNIHNGEEKFLSNSEFDLYKIELIFREDSFDPVSRIRRGRFYKKGDTQPRRWQVCSTRGVYYNKHNLNDVATFDSCQISKDYLSNLKQPLVILGYEPNATIWTIVSIETTLLREEVVALRSRKTIGMLPVIKGEFFQDLEKLKQNEHPSALEILERDINLATPESVVDRSREAAVEILNVFLYQKNSKVDKIEDLGGTLNAFKGYLSESNKDKEYVIVQCAAKIIQRLHPRNKVVEQVNRDIPPVEEQNAELAIQCVGAILCDLGFASWNNY